MVGAHPETVVVHIEGHVEEDQVLEEQTGEDPEIKLENHAINLQEAVIELHPLANLQVVWGLFRDYKEVRSSLE